MFSNFIAFLKRESRRVGVCCLDFLRHKTFVPKLAAFLCFGGILFGAAFLVYFAIVSPEVPPENLVAALQDVAAYYQDPGNSYASSVVVLPPEEEQEWAVLSSYAAQEDPIGAGTQIEDRSADIEYHIRPGETLSEIAYTYNISYEVLAYYNKITNANRIRVGTVIRIPSLENSKALEVELVSRPQRTQAAPVKTTAKTVKIAYESRNNGDVGGSGITVQFSIVDPPAESFQSFEWNFGDGKRGFRPNPSYEYTTPKTYVASLTARDTAGTVYKSPPLYIDIPHPGSVVEHSTTKFITLSSPDEYFVIYGTIIKVSRYPDISSSPLDLSESDQFLTKVRFKEPGFYGITALEANNREQYYSVFVSPVPTMHADIATENYNWYRTQYNTGTQSNCGPASASMAIGWSLGKYFSVSSVRQAIGWRGDGGTSFEELIRVIKAQGAPATIQPLKTVQHIKDVIDSGGIAIVLFHTSGVRMARSDPLSDLFGKYYNDSVGHYIIIKGYSLDGEYFVIHDPIPSDWAVNSFRYSDELSMIGRNRYYSSAEVLNSLRRLDMIVVPRQMNP
ncbi:MAG: LysM peptidoglycan-binding domain-containing protein [Spirochaetaceae bacterium]|jgi:LysM repeat protein|nr:LysM peptidoglycan-binding domain-containing protein [Spirochaetaceae bacterium]